MEGAWADRIARARLRKAIAVEVIAWCQQQRGRWIDPMIALELHETHARHARELGDHETAEQAERRHERALGAFARRRV